VPERAPKPVERQLDELVRALPKTETHLHLEGALPIDLLRQVRPDAPRRSWRESFKFGGFDDFLAELLAWQGAWFTSAERYHIAAREVFRRHLDENVRYVEVSFASGALESAQLDGAEVLAAIRAAIPSGLEVRIFLGIHHDGFTPRMGPVLRECLDWEGLAGLDLHGAENVPLEPWTAPLWRAARERGKKTKAHAGELMGPGFVWQVLEELAPDRIEHGLRAAEDERLVAALIRRGIALDMCPISNEKLVSGVTLENHPIRHLYDAGVTVTLSTDDPLSFGNSVSDEYIALVERRGFARHEIVEIAKNGFRVADLAKEAKESFCEEIDRVAREFSS
jgi:adenine deaminase